MSADTTTRIIIAGLSGTTVMTVFMTLIHWLKLANADMIRAIGSLLTRSIDNAFWPGLLIHYTAGVVFAFPYAVLVGMAPIETRQGLLLVTTAVGTFHGLVMSLLLAVLVAENHPLEQFRKAGTGVVVAHLFGHVLYGLTVGIAFIALDVRLPKLFGL